MKQQYDIIFVGGGLSSFLGTASILHAKPHTQILIIEPQEYLGGNHTWSFHWTDLDDPRSSLVWLNHFVDFCWGSYAVKFPAYRRSFDAKYGCIISRSADLKLRSHESLRIARATAKDLADDFVVCEDGSKFSAPIVLDSRPLAQFKPLGYQKFVGLEIILRTPHTFDGPMLMDACVEQRDGFRFMYVLPFSNQRVLIEDTYYSESSFLDPKRCSEDIVKYAEDTLGLSPDFIAREETGALPLPGIYTPKSDRYSIGYRAGLFNATTGYSVAEAVRFAEWLRLQDLKSDYKFYEKLAQYRKSVFSRMNFYRRLNSMLFQGATAEQRLSILEKFYRYDPKIIEHFYAGKLTFYDRLRILSGKPPIPIFKGIQSFLGLAKGQVHEF